MGDQKLRDAAPSVPLSATFMLLVEETSTKMTHRFNSLITYLQQRDGEAVQQKKKRGRAKQQLGQDTKMVPNLVYQVEQFERHLIKLTKRSKTNLARFIKRSTARDFRIQVQKIASESEDSDTDKKHVRLHEPEA
ncbi:FANCI solenoid 4-domain-containing protein [Entophlyctis helioformis]|nr:FANCI solenoid 4-domain-containing protein [Entophlyctis helioformis]